MKKIRRGQDIASHVKNAHSMSSTSLRDAFPRTGEPVRPHVGIPFDFKFHAQFVVRIMTPLHWRHSFRCVLGSLVRFSLISQR